MSRGSRRGPTYVSMEEEWEAVGVRKERIQSKVEDSERTTEFFLETSDEGKKVVSS